MVRTSWKKQLIGGTLSVDDLPAAWNKLYKEYLGVDVPDDTHGVLQTATGPAAASATSRATPSAALTARSSWTPCARMWTWTR